MVPDMNAIDILMTICLLSDPKACEQRTLPVAEVTSLAECLYWAQPRIAEWSTSHPKYRIVRWRCAKAGAEGEPI
ncbi:hypothetical protein [Oharaeibacter diazotrophicus]|nr:hypothetical protein [Oharaeibacter diazotrophicus]GLS77059.1 hypothetical protein GCM10007904_23960 [Oharaeibacter diazotrophicus]